EDGVNGNASLNLGTNDKYSASVSLNRRKGKLNLFGSYDFQQNTYWYRNTLRQLSQDADGRSTATSQVASGEQQNLTHAGRLGLDYNFTPEHLLTLAVQPSYNENRIP